MCETIAMARRSDAPPPDLITPLPMDLPGLEEALTALLAERASLQDTLAAHPERERRLLARKAPEAEIAANDIQRRRIVFQLDQIDDREQQVRAAMQTAKYDRQLAAWAGFVDEFDARSARFVEASQAMAAAHDDLIDLHRRAMATGFNEHEHPTARIPMPMFRIDYVGIAAFRGHLSSLRRIDARAPDRPQLYLVQFSKYTIVSDGRSLCAYQANSVAGFKAEAAWRLVEHGRATWADAVPLRSAGVPTKKRTEVPA